MGAFRLPDIGSDQSKVGEALWLGLDVGKRSQGDPISRQGLDKLLSVGNTPTEPVLPILIAARMVKRKLPGLCIMC